MNSDYINLAWEVLHEAGIRTDDFRILEPVALLIEEVATARNEFEFAAEYSKRCRKNIERLLLENSLQKTTIKQLQNDLAAERAKHLRKDDA